MEALIYIPNYEFDNDVKDKFQDYFNRVKQDIADGTLCGNYELETTDMFLASFERLQVFPDNATNGDMIMAMFNPCRIFKYTSDVQVYFLERYYQFFGMSWWNAPYMRGSENE